MEHLKLELQDMVLIGRQGDFGRAVDPLEDKLEKVFIGIDSGSDENTLVDLDGDFNIIKIHQIQDTTTEVAVRKFVEENIDNVVKEVRERIGNLI